MRKDFLCYYTWTQIVINFYVRKKDNEVFIQGWILVDFMSVTKTGAITNLLGIQDNFLELSSFCKALNDLIGDVGSEVDTEGKSWIDRLHQISELLRALQLQTQSKTNQWFRCTRDGEILLAFSEILTIVSIIMYGKKGPGVLFTLIWLS